MRIRRCASRLLGSAYSSPPPDPAPRFEQLPLPPPPPPPARPCPSATESYGGGGCFAHEAASGQPPCEQNRSPWDLMYQLDPSDPQEQEEFEETYLVCVSFRSSWAVKEEEAEEIAVAMVDGVRVKPRDKLAKKTAARKTVVKKRKTEKENKECEPKKKKAKVKAEEGDGVAAGEAQLWTCKKNDGKRWSCHRLVSQPNSLCVHHTDQRRTCNNLLSESMSTAAPPMPPEDAASKPSTSSKPRRKKPVVDVGEGFYYYAGFGPSRSNRQCRSSSMQLSPPPAEQNEAPEDHSAALTAGQAQADDSAHLQAAARAGEPSCGNDIAWIAGGDEESSDGEPRVVGVNGDSKRKSPLKKRWRKPVKARSLKSLM